MPGEALRRDLRRRRARRQPAPAARHALPRARRPALPRHLQRGREGPAPRRAYAALRRGGRFRPARDRVQLLHLLADRGAAPGRPHRGGARALRQDAGAADPGRAAFGGHRFRNRRAVGQLSADLFACRIDQLRGLAVASLELGHDEPADRHFQPRFGAQGAQRRRRAGRAGGGARGGACANTRGIWFGWSGNKTDEFTGQINLPARRRRHHRDDRPRGAGRRRIL